MQRANYKIPKIKNQNRQNILKLIFVSTFIVVGTILLWRSFAAENIQSVAIASTNDNKGYLIATAQGHVIAKGSAQYRGSPFKQKVQLSQKITDLASLPNGNGYFVLGGDGSVFAYGDAQKYGEPAKVREVGFYTSIVSTPSGLGYWIISRIGTTYSFGDALTTYKINFGRSNYSVAYGGIAGVSAITAADRTETGEGLYLQDEKGKTYVVGDAESRGGIVELLVSGEKATGIAAENTNSYLIVSEQGRVQSRGTGTKNVGDKSADNLRTKIVDISKFGRAQDNNVGYWLLGENGRVFHFGQAKDYGSVMPGDTSEDVPPDNTTKPDIIVIYTDDQRFDEVDFMPNLNRYIKNLGVTFRNAFALNPICCPSRATLLTGGDSSDTKVWNNYSPMGGYQVFKKQEDDTIATRLKAKGYRTGLFGKYMNQYQGDGGKIPPVPPGWDVWRAFRGINGDYYDYDLVVGDGKQETYRNKINGAPDPADYSTDVLGKYLNTFLRNTATDKPLFALFTPYAPHVTPAVPPNHINTPVPKFTPRGAYNEEDVSDKPGYISRYSPNISNKERSKVNTAKISDYVVKTRKTLLAVDDVIGAIIATQQSRGRLENTLFIFASDNGYNWGEHRFVGKETPYEESIKIPLIIRFDPQTKKTPSNEERLVTNADLAATITAYAGTTAPKNAGKSLKPLIAKENPVSWREKVDIKHYPAQLNGSTDYSKSVPAWCGFRSDRYKVVWNQPWSKKRGQPIEMPSPKVFEGEFYDLQQDPNENSNLFYDQKYRAQLDQLWPLLQSACSKPPANMDKPPKAAPSINQASKLSITTCSGSETPKQQSWVQKLLNQIIQFFTRKSPEQRSVAASSICTANEPQEVINED